MFDRSKQIGFTVVELLIVIVVIAILAAIAIVGYNSISQRAQNAAYQADVRTMLNKLGVFYSTYGRYPAPSDTTMNDGVSPESLPSDVQIIYTNIGSTNSMRNSIGRSTTARAPFVIGTYPNTLYINPTTGVKSYVAKYCLDPNDSTKVVGLRIYYPDILNDVNQIGRVKYVDFGRTQPNCAATP